MPIVKGNNADDSGADDGAALEMAPLVNADSSREGSTARSGVDFIATSPKANCAAESRKESTREEALPGGRSRRPSSVIVYPEEDDADKPKVFARQSFVVSGEEEEMAETILRARELAGERRRSSLKPEQVAGKQGEIVAVAQNLAERRNSLKKMEGPSTAAAAVARTSTQAGVATDPAVGDPDAARRRSSVLNRIPDNLRALVQQSDASGVQQKMDSPYPPRQDGVIPSESNECDDAASTTTRPVGGDKHKSWFRRVLASIRWKNFRIKTRRTKGSGGKGKRGDRGTPATTPTPARSEKIHSLLPKQLPMFAGRKKLILDLDETLIHSCFKPVLGADIVMNIDVEGTHYKVFVRKRPGVEEFLKRVARLYEVIIFTASLSPYANPLLDTLDPTGYITSRLFREHCTFHEGYFVKDLTLLRHESLESTIIVDNSPMAYMFQPENAIDCTSWIDEKRDTELYVIADFLEAIVDVPDVRDLLEFWREGGNILRNTE